MIFDLHTHSNISDGALSPNELIQRAKQFNVDVLSITDHDTIDAYNAIDQTELANINIIPGIEFSTYWRKINIHIVGLNVDINSPVLKKIVKRQHTARQERAEKILTILSQKLNIDITLDEIKQYSINNIIGRPHIAEYLVQRKLVKNIQHAFDKYLGEKKIANIKQIWLDLETIIDAINRSNGVAIIAHPAKYKLTRTKLIELINDFKTLGGQGIEVVSGKQSPKLACELGKITNDHELYASCGSDFHQPNTYSSEPGQFQRLPAECRPVWDLF